MTARAIAAELRVPLYLVRFESMITKFMGESAAKLKLVFDSMSSLRAVFLFDEFDAIGAQRALPNDTGEIHRILNSFLKFIEEDESDSLIVAATNHAEILDRALVRRFDDVLTYMLPGRSELATTLIRTLGSFSTKVEDWDAIAKDAEGLSYAEVVRACEDAAKDMVLDGRQSLSADELAFALRERRRAQLALDAR